SCSIPLPGHAGDIVLHRSVAEGIARGVGNEEAEVRARRTGGRCVYSDIEDEIVARGLSQGGRSGWTPVSPRLARFTRRRQRHRAKREATDLEVVGTATCQIEDKARLVAARLVVAANALQVSKTGPGEDGKDRVVIAAEGIRVDPYICGRSEGIPHAGDDRSAGEVRLKGLQRRAGRALDRVVREIGDGGGVGEIIVIRTGRGWRQWLTVADDSRVRAADL